jgi:phosphoribosylformylglycinamidine synthase PurS subunit
VYIAKIRVTLRPSILDPQGKAIQHAISSLGMDRVSDVRMGKYIEMKIASDDRAEADRIASEACRKLLANPVMEDFQYTLEKT